ncbi:hypothetical protein NMY22_g11218 [Coprinellus aureogranulatus]|nr:hypothetical protein NMY22_g11218 [Coprinellus aureogranulatus]
MRAAVESYSQEVWNIDKFFSFWFRRPQEFRRVLAETGAVVTGSQAIQYFDRQPQLPGSDLDIFTRVGGALPLMMFLTSQGYVKRLRCWPFSGDSYPAITEVFSITSSQNFRTGGGDVGIVGVLDFEKARWVPKKGFMDAKKVQVIIVNRPPIEQIVLRFHSTGVMNFITHKQAVSLFPFATFEKRIFYVSKTTPMGDEWKPAWIDKYSKRGFSIDTRERHPFLVVGKRFIDDEHTWCIDFGGGDSDPYHRIAQTELNSIYVSNESEDFDWELTWAHELSDSDMSLRPRRPLEDGPALMHRLHAFPGSSFRPLHQEGTIETQQAIVRITNASQFMPSDTVEAIVAQLSTYIAPDSSFYITEYCTTVDIEFRSQMRAFFIWMKSSDLDLGSEAPVAPYAVIFCILTGERFRAISLAQVLVDVLLSYRSNVLFNLISVCYKFWLGGVMGVMFFGYDFEGSYRRVLDVAQSAGEGTDIWNGHAVTFYPPGRAMAVTQRSYQLPQLYALKLPKTMVPSRVKAQGRLPLKGPFILTVSLSICYFPPGMSTPSHYHLHITYHLTWEASNRSGAVCCLSSSELQDLYTSSFARHVRVFRHASSPS